MDEMSWFLQIAICQQVVVNGVNVSAPLSNIEWMELSSKTRFQHELMSFNTFVGIVSVVSTIKN